MKWFAVALLSLASLARATETLTLTGRAMGTGWTVKLATADRDCDLGAIRRHVAEKLEQLEQLFSTYRPNSELSRFNASHHTEWIAVAPEVARVAAESRRISELTGGAFDG